MEEEAVFCKEVDPNTNVDVDGNVCVIRDWDEGESIAIVASKSCLVTDEIGVTAAEAGAEVLGGTFKDELDIVDSGESAVSTRCWQR